MTDQLEDQDEITCTHSWPNWCWVCQEALLRMGPGEDFQVVKAEVFKELLRETEIVLASWEEQYEEIAS